MLAVRQAEIDQLFRQVGADPETILRQHGRFQRQLRRDELFDLLLAGHRAALVVDDGGAAVIENINAVRPTGQGEFAAGGDKRQPSRFLHVWRSQARAAFALHHDKALRGIQEARPPQRQRGPGDARLREQIIRDLCQLLQGVIRQCHGMAANEFLHHRMQDIAAF